MAAAVALMVEVLALAPAFVVLAAERLEESAVVVEVVLRSVASLESEAVSAGRRTAGLELLVAPWIPELDRVQCRCLYRWHLGLHYGLRPRYRSRPYQIGRAHV